MDFDMETKTDDISWFNYEELDAKTVAIYTIPTTLLLAGGIYMYMNMKKKK